MVYLRSPYDFFTKVVVPNYRDFASDIRDGRKGLNAAVWTLHVADYLYEDRIAVDPEYWTRFIAAGPKKKERERYTTYLEAAQPAMKTLRGLANGAKHFDMSKPRLTLSIHATLDFFAASPLGIIPPQIKVAEDGRMNLPLMRLLRTVMDWWPDVLRQHGCWPANVESPKQDWIDPT
ncbi:MAG: hypothetical protein KIT81_14410 [Alphaproteobacteria bacterium]|nr:hypothetical protein [Alphaproteobacteria bacterium]